MIIALGGGTAMNYAKVILLNKINNIIIIIIIIIIINQNK